MENVKAVLFKGKKLKDGTSPVMIQVTNGSKRTYKSTGVSLKPSQWDTVKNRPRKSAPNYEFAVERIRQLIGQTLNDLEKESQVLESEKCTKTIGEYLEEIIREQGENGQLGNQSIYITARNELRHWLGYWLCHPFTAINERLLMQIMDSMKSRGCKDTTIHNRLRTIRAIYNRAVKDGHAPKDDNPFDHFKLSSLNLATSKRCLTKEQVKAVINYKMEYGDTPQTELARDVFAFSYLCGGVPFYDLCQLTYNNIYGNSLTYVRQKTHQQIQIGIPAEAQNIIKKYKSKSKGYLFPILNVDVHKTATQKRDRIKKMYYHLNRELNKIGDRLNLPIKLTTYVARHSFATVLRREGVPIEVISEALGHKSLTTTRVYLDSFSTEQFLEAQSKLL